MDHSHPHQQEQKMSSFYAAIMAGGVGTRLWPLSRQACPKQALELLGDRTLFQRTIDRLAPLLSPDRIVVVTGQKYAEILRPQAPELPDDNFILEPMGRDSGPAAALGALQLQRRDPEAVMAMLPADHYIADEERFRAALSAAVKVAQTGKIVTLGIKPEFPSTGFGYIRQGGALGHFDGFEVFRAEQFAEKPDLVTASAFFESGRYSWNSGMFIWRVDRLLAEFQRQRPLTYRQLMTIADAMGTPDEVRVLAEVWPRIEKVSVDYAIMEGARDVAVIPVDIGWSDVGSWATLLEIIPGDDQGNVVFGEHLAVDTTRTLVRGKDRLVVTIGLEDMIVVDTDDALLICPRDRAQDVKAVVDRLRQDGQNELL
jgi:mannose-1-phosphate guanylyltransferase